MLGVKTKKDRETIEATPLEALSLPGSSYALLRGAADAYGDNPALQFIEDGLAFAGAKGDISVAEISYRDLYARVTQAANLFRSLSGDQAPTIGMVLPNTPDAHVTLWGGSTAGRVCPVNYMLDGDMIGGIVAAAGCNIVVVMGDHPQCDIYPKIEKILAAAPSVQHVLVAGPHAGMLKDGHLDFASAYGAQPADALTFAEPEDPEAGCALFHTGGTTGFPKLAQHKHKNHVFTGWALAQWMGLGPNSRSMTGLPLFHCNASVATGLSVFSAGGAVVLAGMHGYRSPGILDNMFRIIEHFGVTQFSAVPTVFGALCQMDIGDCDVSSLEYAVCGAAPMPVALFEKYQTKFGCRIIEAYGLTEGTVCATANPLADTNQRIGSIGISLPYVTLKVAALDADGKFVADCAEGEAGSILISGPIVSAGYTDETKNADLFVTAPHGSVWLNTGDLGYQDADGYFWLSGRSKEIIIRGGHNIDPKVIEEALAKHPAVTMAAAIARPDSYAGEIPVAYVEIREEVSVEDLMQYCKDTISERAAVPKHIVTVDELPRTTVGKIHKPTLKLKDAELLVAADLSDFADQLDGYDCSVKDKSGGGMSIAIRLQPKAGTDTDALVAKVTETFAVYSFDTAVTV